MKTIKGPAKLITELLNDLEQLTTQCTGRIYPRRGFALASAEKLADMAKLETACPEYNAWLETHAKMLAEINADIYHKKTLALCGIELHQGDDRATKNKNGKIKGYLQFQKIQ